MSKLYGYGAVLGTVNRITTGMRRQSDQAIATLNQVEDARAELATVVTKEHAFAGMDRGETLETLEGFASRTAAGQTQYGRVIGTTRAESMSAMFLAAASGIKGEPILELAAVTPILAKAGQTDVRTAGKLLMEQFSLWGGRERVAAAPADERVDVARRESLFVADMLAKGQDSFAAGSLAEYGTAIQRVAPIARTRGYSMEETFTLTGMLGDYGFKGARGGMAGRMMIREMGPGLDKLEKMGVDTSSVRRADPTLYGRLSAIRELGLIPDQISKAFGARVEPAMSALFEEGRLERLPQGLGDYAGTALENAQEHAKTFANVLRQQVALYGELQAEMAVGATSVRKTDTAVANFFVRNLNKLPPIVQRAAGSVLEITGQAGRLTSGILDLSMGLFGLQQITGRRFGVGPKMFAGTQAGFARTQVSWLKMFAQANAGLTALSVRMRTAFAAGGMGAPGAGLRPGAPMPPGARMGGAQRSFAVAPYGAGMGGPGAYGQQAYAGPATRAARGPGAAGAAGMMAAAATMTYLNYELINLVKGGLAKERGLREEGKTADNKWPWLGEQIDKLMGIWVAPAETAETAPAPGSAAETTASGATTVAPGTALAEAVAPGATIAPVEPATGIDATAPGTLTVPPATAAAGFRERRQAPSVATTPETVAPGATASDAVTVPATAAAPGETVAPGTPTVSAPPAEKRRGLFGRLADTASNLWQGVTGKVAAAQAAGVPTLVPNLAAATDKVLQPVADRLPQSDARVGPLSNLTAAGRAIPETMARGVLDSAGSLSSAVAFAVGGSAETGGGGDAGSVGLMEAVQELTDVIREQGAAGAGGANDSGSIGSSRELEVIDTLDSLGGAFDL